MTANSHDAARNEIENAVACIIDADEHLRCAALKLANWARTDLEADVLREIVAARRIIANARRHAVSIHPDALCQED